MRGNSEPCIWTSRVLYMPGKYSTKGATSPDRELVLEQSLGLGKCILLCQIGDCQLELRNVKFCLYPYKVHSCHSMQCFKLLQRFGLSALILCTQSPAPYWGFDPKTCAIALLMNYILSPSHNFHILEESYLGGTHSSVLLHSVGAKTCTLRRS